MSLLLTIETAVTQRFSTDVLLVGVGANQHEYHPLISSTGVMQQELGPPLVPQLTYPTYTVDLDAPPRAISVGADATLQQGEGEGPYRTFFTGKVAQVLQQGPNQTRLILRSQVEEKSGVYTQATATDLATIAAALATEGGFTTDFTTWAAESDNPDGTIEQALPTPLGQLIAQAAFEGFYTAYVEGDKITGVPMAPEAPSPLEAFPEPVQRRIAGRGTPTAWDYDILRDPFHEHITRLNLRTGTDVRVYEDANHAADATRGREILLDLKFIAADDMNVWAERFLDRHNTEPIYLRGTFPGVFLVGDQRYADFRESALTGQFEHVNGVANRYQVVQAVYDPQANTTRVLAKKIVAPPAYSSTGLTPVNSYTVQVEDAPSPSAVGTIPFQNGINFTGRRYSAYSVRQDIDINIDDINFEEISWSLVYSIDSTTITGGFWSFADGDDQSNNKKKTVLGKITKTELLASTAANTIADSSRDPISEGVSLGDNVELWDFGPGPTYTNRLGFFRFFVVRDTDNALWIFSRFDVRGARTYRGIWGLEHGSPWLSGEFVLTFETSSGARNNDVRFDASSPSDLERYDSSDSTWKDIPATATNEPQNNDVRYDDSSPSDLERYDDSDDTWKDIPASGGTGVVQTNAVRYDDSSPSDLEWYDGTTWVDIPASGGSGGGGGGAGLEEVFSQNVDITTANVFVDTGYDLPSSYATDLWIVQLGSRIAPCALFYGSEIHGGTVGGPVAGFLSMDFTSRAGGAVDVAVYFAQNNSNLLMGASNVTRGDATPLRIWRLQTSSSGGGGTGSGLTQAQVDARVRALVKDFAEQGNTAKPAPGDLAPIPSGGAGDKVLKTNSAGTETRWLDEGSTDDTVTRPKIEELTCYWTGSRTRPEAPTALTDTQKVNRTFLPTLVSQAGSQAATFEVPVPTPTRPAVWVLRRTWSDNKDFATDWVVQRIIFYYTREVQQYAYQLTNVLANPSVVQPSNGQRTEDATPAGWTRTYPTVADNNRYIYRISRQLIGGSIYWTEWGGVELVERYIPPAAGVTSTGFSWSTPAIPRLIQGQLYTQNRTISNSEPDFAMPTVSSGGTSPYTYSVVYGALPTGMALHSSNTRLQGRPTNTGTYTVAWRATDSRSPNARTDTITMTFYVDAGDAAMEWGAGDTEIFLTTKERDIRPAAPLLPVATSERSGTTITYGSEGTVPSFITVNTSTRAVTVNADAPTVTNARGYSFIWTATDGTQTIRQRIHVLVQTEYALTETSAKTFETEDTASSEQTSEQRLTLNVRTGATGASSGDTGQAASTGASGNTGAGGSFRGGTGSGGSGHTGSASGSSGSGNTSGGGSFRTSTGSASGGSGTTGSGGSFRTSTSSGGGGSTGSGGSFRTSTGTTQGHSHFVAVGSHSHSVSSHSHSMAVGSHSHSYSAVSHSHSMAVGSHSHGYSVSSSSHSHSIGSHTHQVATGSHRHTFTSGASTHTHSLNAHTHSSGSLAINPVSHSHSFIHKHNLNLKIARR